MILLFPCAGLGLVQGWPTEDPRPASCVWRAALGAGTATRRDEARAGGHASAPDIF